MAVLDPLMANKPPTLGGGRPVGPDMQTGIVGGPIALPGAPPMSAGLPPMKSQPGPTLGGPGPRPGTDMQIASGPSIMNTAPPGTQPPSATSPYAPPPAAGGGGGSPNPSQLAGFERFANEAYNQSTRRLDPQFQQADATFRQQMVNRGLSEGTEAFDKARANFSMDRNDAYSQARSQALAQALGAQGQAFGQQFQDRSLAQQNSQFGQNMGFQYAGLNENNRQFNNGLQENGRQFNAGLGQRESEFGRNFGFQGERADMSDLMSLLGFGQQTTGQNNAALNSDYNRAGGLFGLVPGMSPVQVDVMSPYQMQMQQNQVNQSGQNGMFGALGQIGAAAAPFMLSDERIKTIHAKVGTLDNGLSVYLASYKAGGPPMLMLIAQEVLAVKPDAVRDFDGTLGVDYTRAVAA
jgi:hypothetical protein